MKLNMSFSELMTRGGILDQILDSVSDAAVLLDAAGLIIYCSSRFIGLTDYTHTHTAQKPCKIDEYMDLIQKVLNTRKSQKDIPWTVGGAPAHATLTPICDGLTCIGVLLSFRLDRTNQLKSGYPATQDTDPLSPEYLNHVISRFDSSYSFEDFIGDSQGVLDVIRLCKRAAATLYPVLLIGETGTGKEVLSHAIHSATHGPAAAPFIKINCTAIPHDLLEAELFGYEKGAFTGAVKTKPGKFEIASGGTILLDEIGDMDYRLQGKLLRVLEEREYERVGGNQLIPLNARIIASTNRNLRELCELGRFRADLYYRLSALEIYIPPLRDRRSDIPTIIRQLIVRLRFHIGFTAEAMALLQGYDWPGNVRQVKNVLTRLEITFDKSVIDAGDLRGILPSTPASDVTLPPRADPDEKDRIASALTRCNYNISKASKELGITRATLYKRIRKHGITISRPL